ncbi:hypothetical protein [Streptomyces tauricus]|uniref:hypothetical protein n=1 Tax=Streptomyces tauricus TaxID=68274 RepID=UPI002243CA32|nr:hypothetical protein [Streptomyces tauricus]MCW8102835.1 hypothetical protein [Streptomyces tauricus]
MAAFEAGSSADEGLAVTRAEWDAESAAWDLQERGYDRHHLPAELADILRKGLRM